MFDKLTLVNSLDTSKFYVIVAITNPIRFYSRARLFHSFRKHIKDLGAHLVVVEAAYGARPHAIATKKMCSMGHDHNINNNQFGIPQQFGNRPWWPNRPDVQPANLNNGFEQAQLNGIYNIPNDTPIIQQTGQKEYHIQLRTEHEIWHKENLINIGVQQLTQIDPEWQYVAWIDADVSFQRQDIILETAQQLQHFDIVQMFSHALDLGPDMSPVDSRKVVNGFMWSYNDNNRHFPKGAGYGGYYGYNIKGNFWHPGYAWAMRRRAAEKVALYDKAILGSADHHMAMAMIGCAWKSLPEGVTKEYRDSIVDWENMVTERLRRNVGFVPGLLTHHWHGRKAQRKYVERWKILIDNKYNPHKDISRDPQGLYRLNYHNGDKSIRLRDDIRAYFRQRNEDSIDVDE